MPRMQLPIRLSVAAPAYNESAGIKSVIQHWHQYLKNNKDIQDFEIVICNDGSKDNTGNILDECSAMYCEIKSMHFAMNQGAAAALEAAISKTKFEWVLLIDSDDQFPIENLTRMLEALCASLADAALGIRQKKDSLFARFGTKASGLVCNWAHGSKIKDFNSAFKLVPGDLLRSLVLEAKGMNYSTEVTSRLLESGAMLAEVDIEHRPRQTGKSNIKLMRDSMHRFLFVGYILLRQLLFKFGILRRPS